MAENSNIVNIGNRSVSNMTEFGARFKTGVAESKATTVLAGGGQNLLRLLKSGEWVFGMSNEEVQENSKWAINIMSIKHGWNCWSRYEGNQKNELLGEILMPITEAKPIKPQPIQGFEYVEMRAFDLKCIDGVDSGTQVLYKINSFGGMQAVTALLDDISRQIDIDPVHSCPVVMLNVDSYQHPKWGQTFVPVFDIVGWVDINCNPADDEQGEIDAPAQPAGEPAATVVPAKPRKASLNADVPAATKTAKKEPVPTAATRTGQRRRPGR